MSLALSTTTTTTSRSTVNTAARHVAVRAVEFVAISLQVLVTAAFFGSWIGLSRSIDTLSPATFVEVGHVMMEDYGPIMSVLMPAALLVTLVAAVLVYRRNTLAGYLMLAGAAGVAAAMAITLIVNVPIDEMMANWTVSTLPPDWMQIRDRWETFHTLRTFVSLAAVGVTLIASLVQPRPAAAE